MAATTTLTTAQVAAELATTPRELRKFLRDQGASVGKGSRYALPGTKREMTALAKKFAAWAEDKAAEKAAKDEAPEEVEEVEED